MLDRGLGRGTEACLMNYTQSGNNLGRPRAPLGRLPRKPRWVETLPRSASDISEQAGLDGK